jgi:hypothetical protein
MRNVLENLRGLAVPVLLTLIVASLWYIGSAGEWLAESYRQGPASPSAVVDPGSAPFSRTL